MLTGGLFVEHADDYCLPRSSPTSVIRPASSCTLSAACRVELSLSTSIACLLVEVYFALGPSALPGFCRDDRGRVGLVFSHSACVLVKPRRILPTPGRIGLWQTGHVGFGRGF